MHSYLIISKDNNYENQIEVITKGCINSIYKYDISSVEEARNLKKDLLTAPHIKSFYIINKVDDFNEETSNTLLKILEEPPINVNFILTTSNFYKVLPTIVSRCQVININTKDKSESNSLKNKLNYHTLNKNEKYKIISGYYKREEAIQLLERIINEYWILLKNDENTKTIIRILAVLNQTYINIKANGNIKLNLNNFFIQTNI